MAGVEGEDEFRDALAAADPPPSAPSPTSKPRPAAAAGGGGGGGLRRRLFASIPLPASLSAAIGRFSSPKPPASNVGLGLLLHAGPPCSVDGTPAADAVSVGSSLHLSPVSALQRQHGEDQVATRGTVVEEEEGLGLVQAEEGRLTAEGQVDNEGVAVDVCSANRNSFPLRGQEEEGRQCPGDELGIAVDGSMAQDQEEEVVVEKEGATLDCASVVEDQSNNFSVEHCAGHETRAVKDGDALEVNESVMEQEGAVGILDAAEDSVTVESQEENVVVAEQGEDCISVQNQHELVEQCTGDQLRTITSGDAVQDQEVVELEGAADCYTALEAVEQCTTNGSKSVNDGNMVEEEERAVQQEGGVGVLDAAKDDAPVESQEEGVLVPEQNEGDISVQDHHMVVEQCTGDQLRTAKYDNDAQDQEVIKLEGATNYYTSVEAVEQCTNDVSRSVKCGNVVEENEKEVEHEIAVGILDTAKDHVIVESQEEDLVVAEQGEDGIFVQDQHKVMVQCSCHQLRTTMDDNAAEGQEVVEQYGAIVDRDATADVIAVEDQETEVKQPAVHESRAIEDENAVEVNKKVVDQEDVIEKHGAIKDGGAAVLLEENDVVDVEQGGDVISLQDEGNLGEEYNSGKLGATMEDNAAENQQVVEQEGAIVERVVTTDVISVKDQEKEVEQIAGGESRVTKDDSVVEDNGKVHQEYAIDKQGMIKDGSGEESLEEDDMVVAEQGADEFSVLDLGNVVEQCTSGQRRTTMEDNTAECQEVVVQGVIFKRGMADGINVEDQGKEVEQSAGDESRATKDKKDKEEADKEDAIDKHGTTKDGNDVESQEEENMVVPDQDVDVISVLNEGTAKLVVQCTSDQLRTTTDDNAAEDPEVAEQEIVVSLLGADKVSIAVESREVNIVGAEQVEDGVSVQDQDKGVEQFTSDQLRTTINDNDVKDQEVRRENIGFSSGYPQRPGKLNCRFYMSTGSCSYGSSCHFNHPRMKPKLEVSSLPAEQRDREVEFLELNRVGLPIREGARKCTYYMRYGTCRYGKKCCYNHPEEVLDTQLYTPTGWDDTSLQSSPHSKKSPEHATIDDVSSGSEILPPNILRMLLPPQNVPPCTEEMEMKLKKDPDWSSASDDSDGCCSADSSDGPLCKQEHVDYPERPECPFLLKFGNCKFATSCQYYHPKEKFPSRYHPKEKFPSRYHPKKDPPLAELTIYPDRPGEPECPFYVKTGSCKFGTNCKFHHPKDLTPILQDSASPKRSVAANEHHQAAGTTLQDHMYQQQKYPERPGQPDCRYYMQFGKCKFQSACIFNHPKDILSSGWHPAECPFFMKTGTCQFGSACEFYHPKDNSPSRGGALDNGTDREHGFVTKSEIVLQQLEQTIYPERPGEPECPHYMKHGYCKFQMSCKFHHPADRLLTK